jgi:hypothetical protein
MSENIDIHKNTKEGCNLSIRMNPSNIALLNRTAHHLGLNKTATITFALIKIAREEGLTSPPKDTSPAEKKTDPPPVKYDPPMHGPKVPITFDVPPNIRETVARLSEKTGQSKAAIWIRAIKELAERETVSVPQYTRDEPNAEPKEKEIIKSAMGLLGKRTSDHKKISSAENGKKGGRPRKPTTEPPRRSVGGEGVDITGRQDHGTL